MICLQSFCSRLRLMKRGMEGSKTFNFSPAKHQTIILKKICIFWASLLLIDVFGTIVRLLAIISAECECFWYWARKKTGADEDILF